MAKASRRDFVRSITFNQEYATCSSKGKLESKLFGFLRAELQR